MPELARFHGIVIRMFHRDHAPPHLHAHFGEHEITMDINTCSVNGAFPAPAIRSVRVWVELHRNELLECWRLARENRPIPPVPPLE